MLKGLKKVRKTSGLKQDQAAKMLGIPLSTYRNWEQCKTAPASLTTLIDLMRFFGCSLDELIFGPNDAPARFPRTYGLAYEDALIKLADGFAEDAQIVSDLDLAYRHVTRMELEMEFQYKHRIAMLTVADLFDKDVLDVMADLEGIGASSWIAEEAPRD